MKYNFWLKIIAPAMVLILGIILFFTVGFNKSLDLSGFYLIEVNIQETKVTDAYEKINTILEDKDLSIKDYILEKDNYGDVIAIKYTTSMKDNSQLQETLKSELMAEFGYDNSSLIEQSYVKVSGFIQPKSMVMTFAACGLSILIGLIGVFVYIALRHNVANAFSIVLSVILDCLLMISLTLIFRLPISSHFGIAIVGTAILSIMLNTIYYSKLVEMSKEENYLKASNEEIIKSAKHNFVHTLILIILTFLIGVGAFAFYSLVTSIALAIGFISAIYTSQVFVPHLWAMAYRKKIKIKKENKE